MPKPEKSLEPQQARSRESLRKLLKAAADVLSKHGVEGATIPRIAKQAGLTPGAVYRRFRDKDALLETVVLAILENQDKAVRMAFTPEMAVRTPLPVLVEEIISAMLSSYRMHTDLLRALRRFSQSKEGTPFWKKAAKMEVSTVEYMTEVLAASRGEIQHPDPRSAIAFALMIVSSMLVQLVLNTPDNKAWKALMPKDDQSLKNELTRAFLSYLGVEQKAS